MITLARSRRYRRWACAGLLVLAASWGRPTRCPAATTTNRPRMSPPAVDGGCRIEDSVFVHGSRRSHDIALTFDACPTSHVPGFAPDIVDTLTRERVPATFFISGRWAEVHPQDLARLSAVPFFETALHGYRHHRLRARVPGGISEEIEDGRQALLRLHVHPQPLFRPPFGDRPHVLAAIAQREGVTPVLWDVAPGDPSPQETAADIERDVLRRTRGGSIVVMHVNGRGVGTAAALPVLVAQLRARGFRFVTVSELLKGCTPATP